MNNCTKKLFRVSPGLRRVDNEILVVEGKGTRTHLKEEDDKEKRGSSTGTKAKDTAYSELYARLDTKE